MTNLKIVFSNPWFLLLLIPAVVLALWPYFRLSRKYRRTRNRIISIIFFLCFSLLAVSVLSGITFAYNQPNLDNEILIVADISHSNSTSDAAKNKFIEDVLNANKDENKSVKLGVVTFARTPVYAAPLSFDTNKVLQDYRLSRNNDFIDDSATNIAAALELARHKITNKKSGKIVLLTDGIETDEKALAVIKSIALDGTIVDTVYFPPDTYTNEFQFMKVSFPNINIMVGDEISIDLTINSVAAGAAKITLSDFDADGDKITKEKPVELRKGETVIAFEHTFAKPFAHELMFEIENVDNRGAGDTLSENNKMYSYCYIAVYDNILIIENGNEANNLINLIREEFKYQVTRVNIDVDYDLVPKTLNQLLKYDEVILMNMSNFDLNKITGLDRALMDYAEAGGGVFTVGGTLGASTVANTYNRDDMSGSLFQRMLPVDCVEFKPPVAVIVIMDRSGSMTYSMGPSGTRIAAAKKCAIEILDNMMDDVDFFGLVSMEDWEILDVPLTPVSHREEIRATINAINTHAGGERYSSALDPAGRALLAAKDKVEKTHIIFIGDGDTTHTDAEYLNIIDRHLRQDITMSVVCLNNAPTSAEVAQARSMATRGGGSVYYFTNFSNDRDSFEALYEDIDIYATPEVFGEPFKPNLGDYTPNVTKGVSEKDIPEIGGYYGTKLKPEATQPLRAKYAPVYAQWDYGTKGGKVGSLMCDLSGSLTSWSYKFIRDDNGKRIIKNIIDGLFPNRSLRVTDISLEFNRENYTTYLSVMTNLGDNDYVDILVTHPVDETTGNRKTVPIKLTESDRGRTSFEFSVPGVYEVTFQKKNSSGAPLSDLYTEHTEFSYSYEYNILSEEDLDASAALVESFAETGKGQFIFPSEPDAVFRGFALTIDNEYNPIIPFIIAAIILFLLDVAVRKFKFKWPWEIVRDYKTKKLLKQGKILKEGKN